MKTSDVLRKLREEHRLTQDELAEKLFVTRQAISRWENGETMPGPDILTQLSKLFDLSVNTLLGSPRTLICQCCGMPLTEDGQISREPDAAFNEDYCKWCYTDGRFIYEKADDLIDFLVRNFSTPEFPPETARTYFSEMISKLKHWQS